MRPTFDHTAIVVSDMETSLRFYQGGLGLTIASDQRVRGNIQRIFGVDAPEMHCIQLAHPEDVNVALVELVQFLDGVDRTQTPKQAAPLRGPWLISFRCDFDETVAAFEQLGHEVVIEAPEHHDPSIELRVGVVEGPDGEIVELMPAELRVTSVRLRERGVVEVV